MNERLKKIRESTGLTQGDFGRRIGITSRAHISALESGLRNITDRIVTDVCREFSISEQWLRDGEGDMFTSLDADQKIAEYVGGLMDGKDTLEKRMFLLWIEMTDNEKELWLRMLQKMGAGLAGGSDE